jgi:hypothetical protein
MEEKRKGLLLVMNEVAPEMEGEFNRWYDEEHISERLTCPGFISARRFQALEGEPKYLALYELESPDVLQSEHYLRDIGNPTELTKKMSKSFISGGRRNVYVEITPDTHKNNP